MAAGIVASMARHLNDLGRHGIADRGRVIIAA
jgi:hypothetical protein